MIPTLRLLSRTTYRGASGSGPGRSGNTAFRSSPDSRKSPTNLASANWFKRSQRGLYDGAKLQSGNNVPNSRQKTRRVFKPNVQRKALYSEILNNWIRLRVTTRALKTIKKKGGLDYYIADTSDWKLGAVGRKLRMKMGSKVKQLKRNAPLSEALAAQGGLQQQKAGRRAAGATLSDVNRTTQALKGMKIDTVRAAQSATSSS